MSDEYPAMQVPADPMPPGYRPYVPPNPDEVDVEISDELAQVVRDARRIVVLSGAGMSAESGVPTFRDAQSGLWERFDPASLATQFAWDDDPEFVWAWYAWRVGLVRRVWPNAGHLAIATWGRRRGVQVITQNVDDLHERAGSTEVAHLHGSLFAYRCAECGHPYDGEIEVPDEPVERLTPPRCEVCGALVRPGVVWFGEYLPQDVMEAATTMIESLEPGDLVLSVGTSGVVYPAAGFPAMARAAGATTVEINPTETEISDHFHHVIRDTAARVLPALAALVAAE